MANLSYPSEDEIEKYIESESRLERVVIAEER